MPLAIYNVVICWPAVFGSCNGKPSDVMAMSRSEVNDTHNANNAQQHSARQVDISHIAWWRGLRASARCIFSAYISDQVARQPLILSITLHTILQYYLFYIYSWYYIIHIIHIDMYYLSFACPACYHSLSRNDMLESFQTMCRRIIILHILCWWIWCQPAAFNHQLTSQSKISDAIFVLLVLWF